MRFLVLILENGFIETRGCAPCSSVVRSSDVFYRAPAPLFHASPCRMAGCGTPTSSAGHAPAGAKTLAPLRVLGPGLGGCLRRGPGEFLAVERQGNADGLELHYFDARFAPQHSFELDLTRRLSAVASEVRAGADLKQRRSLLSDLTDRAAMIFSLEEWQILPTRMMREGRRV